MATTTTHRLPDYLIIGAPRSGTTALSRYLAEHPQVFMSDPKEIWYFNDRGFANGEEWYARHFAAARGDQKAGEATTLYMYQANAIERIAQRLPDVRLVAMLRHPVDRAWSHYWFQRQWRNAKHSFEQMVDDELAGRAEPGDRLLAMGMYAEQLERVDRLFGAGALHVELFDDLRADAVALFKRVCTHIGVDPLQVPSIVGERINPVLEPKFRPLVSVAARLRRLGPQGDRLAERLQGWNRQGFETPELDAALRERLLDVFRGPNARLRERLGRDLAGWDE